MLTRSSARGPTDFNSGPSKLKNVNREPMHRKIINLDLSKNCGALVKLHRICLHSLYEQGYKKLLLISKEGLTSESGQIMKYEVLSGLICRA